MSQLLKEVNFDLSPNTATSAVNIKKELDVLLENFNSEDQEAVPSIQNPLNKVGNEQTTVAVDHSCNKIWKIANENSVKIENDSSASKTNSEEDSPNININTEGLEEENKYKRDFEDQCYKCKLCGHITGNNNSLEHHLKIKHDVRVKLAHNEFEDIEIDLKHHNLSCECLEIEKNEDVKQVITNNQLDDKEKTSTLNDVCNELTQMACENDIEKESHNINTNIEGSEEETKYKRDFKDPCYECKLCGHTTDSSDSLELHLKIKHAVRVKLAHYEFEDIEIDIKHHNLSYECLDMETNKDVKQDITNNQLDNEQKSATLNDGCNELTQVEHRKDIENECTEPTPVNESDNEHNKNSCNRISKLANEKKVNIENYSSTSKTNLADSHNININIEGLEEEIKIKRNFENQCYECKLCGHITKSNDSLEHHLKIRHDVLIKLAQYKLKDIEMYNKHNNQTVTNNESDSKQNTATSNDACSELTQMECKEDIENECTGTVSINECDNEGNENFKFHECLYCRFRTTLIAELNIHTKNVHEDKRYNCQFCDFKTKNRYYLVQHLRRKHDSTRKKYNGETKWFSCELCTYKTKHELDLTQHLKTKHIINEHLCCLYCNYKSENKSSLKKHFKMKHDKYARWYTCFFCLFRTKSLYHYKEHHKEKHANIKYRCEFCEYITPRIHNLKEHFKVKHDEDAEWLKCTLCEYKTKLKGRLVVHMYASHTATRRYKCKICKLRTKYKVDLKRHYTVKHDENAQWYHCDLCQYKTKAKLYLNRHLSLQHRHNENTMQHQCQFCEQKLKSKISLNRHIKFKHEENIGWFYCKVCKFKSKHKLHLSNHIKSTHCEGDVQGSDQ